MINFFYKYIVFFFIFIIPIVSFADTNDNLKQFIDTNAHKIIIALEKNTDESTKKADLYDIFCQIVDWEWMGKFVVAKSWHTMTTEQQNKYLIAYKKYLSGLYIKKFAEYNRQQYKIIDIKNIENFHSIVAMEIINEENKSHINVAYRIKTKDNNLKVVDIIGEGISLLATQRSDFSSLIAQKGINTFINMLEKK